MNNSTRMHAGEQRAVPAVNVDAIPLELQERPQWVNWGEELRGGRPTKVPLQPNGQAAKTSDPATWSPFADVLAAYAAQPSRYSGVGYVFSEDDPYCGIDLDACLGPGTRRVTAWAKVVFDQLGTYTEISPSGCGLKLIGRGRFPFPSGSTGKTYRQLTGHRLAIGKDPEIAAWNRGRYFAMTGNIFAGRRLIHDCQPGINQLFQRYWNHSTRAAAPSAQLNGPPLQGAPVVHPSALAAMRLATASMVDHGDGSKRLYTVACRAVEMNLGDATAVATITAYAQQRPFPTAWTYDQICARLRAAEMTVERGSAAKFYIPTYKRRRRVL